MAKRISAFGPLTKNGCLTPWGFLMFMSHRFWTGTGIVEGVLELDRRYSQKAYSAPGGAWCWTLHRSSVRREGSSMDPGG